MANSALEIVPDNSKVDTEPLSIRFPKDLLRRVDAIAAATGNKRSTTAVHLVAWATTQWEQQEAQRRAGGR